MLRRTVIKTLALSPLSVPFVRAQGAPIAPVRIATLEQLDQVWSDAEFAIQRQPCVLVRLPLEQKHSRALVLTRGETMFNLIAYSRICTHLGCTAALPDGERLLRCGCHGSEFSAVGEPVSGPASTALRGIKLESRDEAVYAVAWL